MVVRAPITEWGGTKVECFLFILSAWIYGSQKLHMEVVSLALTGDRCCHASRFVISAHVMVFLFALTFGTHVIEIKAG